MRGIQDEKCTQDKELDSNNSHLFTHGAQVKASKNKQRILSLRVEE